MAKTDYIATALSMTGLGAVCGGFCFYRRKPAQTDHWGLQKTACDVDCCPTPACFCNRTAHDEFYTDMLAVFHALHVVTNSRPDRIGSGTKRRRPAAAPLCPLKHV